MERQYMLKSALTALAFESVHVANAPWTRWLKTRGLGLPWRKRSIAFATAALAVAPLFGQPSGEIEIRHDLKYATHDGVALAADYYVPKGPGKFPVVIAMHGGGWQLGGRTGFRFLGPYFAQRGIALFSIEYRLSKPGQPSYPKPVQDVRAAIQFVKYKADELKVDPQRVALMGASAGAHLAALAALAGDAAPFAAAYPGDPYATVNAKVKAVVAVFGVYDLVQHWNHELIARPRDQTLEKFLGTTPMDNRRVYFEASPINYAIRDNNQISFFLTWGTGDDMVSPSQSEDFLLALKQAEFFVRTAPVPGAPHYWIAAPIDEPGGYAGFVAPQIVRFLQQRL
jgi:acetyl esterase/lipase